MNKWWALSVRAIDVTGWSKPEYSMNVRVLKGLSTLKIDYIVPLMNIHCYLCEISVQCRNLLGFNLFWKCIRGPLHWFLLSFLFDKLNYTFSFRIWSFSFYLFLIDSWRSVICMNMIMESSAGPSQIIISALGWI